MDHFILNKPYAACEILTLCKAFNYTKLNLQLLEYIEKYELLVSPKQDFEPFNFYVTFLKPFGGEKKIEPMYTYQFPKRPIHVLERTHVFLAFNIYWEYYKQSPGLKHTKIENMVYSMYNINDPNFLKWPMDVLNSSIEITDYVIWVCTTFLYYNQFGFNKHQFDFENYKINLDKWSLSVFRLLDVEKTINIKYAIAWLRFSIVLLACDKDHNYVDETMKEHVIEKTKEWCELVQMGVRRETTQWYNDFIVSAMFFYDSLNDSFDILNYYQEINKLKINLFVIENRMFYYEDCINGNSLVPFTLDDFINNYDEYVKNKIKFLQNYYFNKALKPSNNTLAIFEVEKEKTRFGQFFSQHLYF